MPRRQSSRRNDMLPLLLLFGQLQEIGLNRIPPVTLIFFAINVAVHFMATHIPLSEVCIRPISIIQYGQYERLVLSAFFHADNWHLYYNMASLLWKGMNLERQIGSSRLLIIIIISTVLSSILYVIISASLVNMLEFDSSFHSCAVGFSAVLFALKVVLNYDSNANTMYWGLRIPTKYLCWFELVLISIVSPSASFLGHLCGILVGVICALGAFNPIFRITDNLGIDTVLNRLKEGYNYDQNAQAPRRQQRGFGGMPRGFGYGRRGFGGYGNRHY
eukprot:604173_1